MHIAFRLSICNTSRIDPAATKPLVVPPNASTSRLPPWAAWLPWVLCAVMVVCLVFFVADTLHWPLVGDAVSVHYLILLMQHGMAPYRQVVDAQMPGTYLIDWAVMHIFGSGAPGLRLFDFSLMASAMIAMIAIAWPKPGAARKSFLRDDRWAAFLAGGLFALVHGRDGIPQAGQRDLIMAVLLLAAYAFTFHAVRGNQARLLFFAGICASTAIIIKPTILPAVQVVLVLALWHLSRERSPMGANVLAVITGNLVPVAAALAFLLYDGALLAFLKGGVSLLSYHASLQRRSIPYLLGHSLSPVAVLFLLLVVSIVLRFGMDRMNAERNKLFGPDEVSQPAWERIALYAGMLLALVSFLLQGKGFPYHRYPLMALVLLVAALEFRRAVQSTFDVPGMPIALRRMALSWRVVGIAGLCIAALVIAPISTYKSSRYQWGDDEDFRMMSADLAAAGGPQLSGHVQCIDAFAGCINTLYRMGLVQTTGYIVDFYLFTPSSSPVVQAMRKQFWDEIQKNPPEVFIVTKMVFPISPATPDSYDKLKLWPLFDDYLNAHYEIAAERTPQQYVLLGSRPERPAGYRIYLRKPAVSETGVLKHE